MFRGKDVQEIKELKTQGLSLRAISDLTGYDRKTIRRYLIAGNEQPVYGPRPPSASKLDPFKPYLEQRLQAGVWNAQVLLRELRERNYTGGYTILTDWLRPQRQAAQIVAVRRWTRSWERCCACTKWRSTAGVACRKRSCTTA